MIKYLMLKRQIRYISRQLKNLSDGLSEKVLDISLVDRDLEELAGEFNKYYEMERYKVVCALQHEEHLKETIANISHDLRTPLTVIMGNLQLLQKQEIEEDQRKRIEITVNKARRMKELIATFYDLAILDTECIVLQKERINFSNLLIDFIAGYSPLFENKKIQPEIILPAVSLYINEDRNIIERILENLLTNAIRYSTGKIKVQIYQYMEGKVAFRIENTIQASSGLNVDRLFERFYIGEQSRGSGSTGLGLAVVKILVERIKGKISVSICNNTLVVELII